MLAARPAHRLSCRAAVLKSTREFFDTCPFKADAYLSLPLRVAQTRWLVSKAQNVAECWRVTSEERPRRHSRLRVVCRSPAWAGAEAPGQRPANTCPLSERAAVEAGAPSPVEPAGATVPTGTLTGTSRQLPTQLTPEAEGEIAVCWHGTPLRVDVSFYAAAGDHRRFWWWRRGEARSRKKPGRASEPR